MHTFSSLARVVWNENQTEIGRAFLSVVVGRSLSNLCRVVVEPGSHLRYRREDDDGGGGKTHVRRESGSSMRSKSMMILVMGTDATANFKCGVRAMPRAPVMVGIGVMYDMFTHFIEFCHGFQKRVYGRRKEGEEEDSHA